MKDALMMFHSRKRKSRESSPDPQAFRLCQGKFVGSWSHEPGGQGQVREVTGTFLVIQNGDRKCHIQQKCLLQSYCYPKKTKNAMGWHDGMRLKLCK